MRLALVVAAILILARATPAWADDWGDARKAFRAAQKDDSWKERRAAYIALLDYDGEKAFHEILSALLKEKNAAVVLEGLKTLASFETPEARAAFTAALARLKGTKGAYLLLALARQRGPFGVDILADLVRGKDARLATLAAYALGRKAVEASLPPLIDVLDRAKDWHVVAQAARSIQHIAWSSMTKPDTTSGKLPEPAMPAWFDPKRVLRPLVDRMETSEGAARGALVEALASITKQDFGDNHEAWVLYARGEEPTNSTLSRRRRPAYCFGVPITGRRVVFVFDPSVLGYKTAPFDSGRLAELGRVPGGDPIPAKGIRTIREFMVAHVGRCLRDLPADTRFEVILCGIKTVKVFGRFSSATKANVTKAIEKMENAPGDNGSDALGALTTALDIAGARGSAPWTKGPDEIVCVYTSVPHLAPETDARVIGAAIGMKARMRGIRVHAIGVHEFAYEMMDLLAKLSGGRYLKLSQ